MQIVRWSASLGSIILSFGLAIEIFLRHLDTDGTVLSSQTLCTLNKFNDIFEAGTVGTPVTVLGGEAIQLRYTNNLGNEGSKFVTVDLWASGSQ